MMALSPSSEVQYFFSKPHGLVGFSSLIYPLAVCPGPVTMVTLGFKFQDFSTRTKLQDEFLTPSVPDLWLTHCGN